MLAKKHCNTCHSFVAADRLDQVTFKKKVLPGMAPNLGIGIFGETNHFYLTKTTVFNLFLGDQFDLAGGGQFAWVFHP